MEQHTPGPWEVSVKLGVPGVIKGGVMREYAKGSNQDQLFLVCCVQDDNGGMEATITNAYLAAAIPEMFAALQLAAKINPFGSVENAAARDAAIAALAKATAA